MAKLAPDYVMQRTKSSPFLHRMVPMIFNVLEATIKLGNECDRFDIMAEAGYAEGTVSVAMSSLVHLGLMEKPRYDLYLVTEKGRLAWALETARRNRLNRAASLISRSAGSLHADCEGPRSEP